MFRGEMHEEIQRTARGLQDRICRGEAKLLSSHKFIRDVEISARQASSSFHKKIINLCSMRMNFLLI